MCYGSWWGECGVMWWFYFKIWHFCILMWMTQQREGNGGCRGERKWVLEECSWAGQGNEIYHTGGGLGLTAEARSLSRATGGTEENKGTQNRLSVEMVVGVCQNLFQLLLFSREKESRLIVWERRWGGSVEGVRSPGEGIGCPLQCSWASLVAQLVKNPPAMWETWIRSLSWEDPLEKGKATHSSILA